ncbi:hypothetical protein ACSCBZ_46105 [Streptomyces niveiscabiei]|uniref:hypothetical protein n=1 Tax=Streptomyces niveiscabiei TaxID=164115 RepID=UPI001F0B491A|nr:hypothetical protein [Streptomyces niveiscabiei]
MAALMAAVEPARPVTTTGAGARPDGDDPAAKADPDGVVDRSTPGVTSEQFKAPQDLNGAGDAAGAQHKEGVFKTLIRAGATRWAKGGGATNKRLDLAKARAGAHQVKETRTTTVMKSPGLPTRNGSGGAGGGGRNSGGSGGGNSGRNSSGNGSSGTGRGGSGGGTGGGGRGSNGNGGSGGGRGTSGNGGGGSSKETGSKGAKDSASKGKDGSSGNPGAGGKAGKDGKPGTSGTGGGSTSGGSSGGNSGTSKDTADKGQGAKTDLTKGGGGQGSGGSSGSGGGSGSSGGAGKDGKSGSSGSDGASGTDSRTPLQRSREVGHGDGSAVRDVVDHVVAYAKGTKDGYQDKKEENAKEHARLDEAHADQKAKRRDPKQDDPEQQETTVTGPSGQTIVITSDEGDDGVSTDVKPLLVKEIDANTLTLGTDGARGSVSRKELRNFKQYERKLEAKEDHLIKVADACKQLEAAAEDEARDCQQLAEQAKAVKGGEKLAATLTKLADAAKAQAAEAAELHKRATRAAEMCKVVLTNIGTRYAPLYKAVVDSDETKPAELRFYNDKGSYAPAA